VWVRLWDWVDRDARQAPPFGAGKDRANGGALLWVYLSAVSVAARCTGARKKNHVNVYLENTVPLMSNIFVITHRPGV